MGYVLSAIGGAFFGSVLSIGLMCCFIVSGEESRKEEMRDGSRKNTSDGF